MGRHEQARARAQAMRAARHGRAVDYINCDILDVDEIDCYVDINNVDDL
jgi:hypothetical protein